MRVIARIESTLRGQRGHLFPWIPVFLSIGIGTYFAFRFEPGWPLITGIAASGLLCLAWGIRNRSGFAAIAWALCMICAGVCLASTRAQLVAEPVLDFRYYGPVQGRIINIDRSASGAERLTLDQVILRNVRPEKTPAIVRVSMHGRQDWLVPKAYQTVGLIGHLIPSSGPVEPGGFDFQRDAWFKRIGAVGYTRSPVLEMAPPDRDLSVLGLRHRISDEIQRFLKGQSLGLAVAITTGDRRWISQDTIETLRKTNLAHLLAISGLHMGLLVGFTYGLVRLSLALWQPVALRLNTKRVAALVAISAATVYLLLSGASIATERAYIMACTALVAVMINRRAISMRAVGIAAILVLLMRPESLLSPGFQMSFSATTALVAVFGLVRDHGPLPLPKWSKEAFAVVLSSLVAGLATAPFAAAHFNHWAAYGLLANLMSVPVMGFLVIPAAVVALILFPLGLHGIALKVMGFGLDWILGVANFVAGLEGASLPIVTPQPVVLPLLSLGALVLILWQGRLRLIGGLPVAFALVLWSMTQRPDVLIADTGNLIGVMTDQGRALSKVKGQGFVATNWLENDGDAATQAQAALRAQDETKPIFVVTTGGVTYWHISGKRAASQFTGCAPKDIVISNQPLDQIGECTIISPNKLKSTGAIAIYHRSEKTTQITANDLRGQRLWTR